MNITTLSLILAILCVCLHMYSMCAHVCVQHTYVWLCVHACAWVYACMCVSQVASYDVNMLHIKPVMVLLHLL